MTNRTVRAERADGIRSRETILNAAARLATIEGLEGLSIGRLAEHIGMSKSGLYAHFGSKEELQLATIDTASAIFTDVVVKTALTIEDPVDRLLALCDAFLDHVRRRVFPGGCFFASSAAEFDTRPGPVRTRIAEVQAGWMELLQETLESAQARELISRSEEARQLAFELDAFLAMGNTLFVLRDDPQALDRAATAVRARLEHAGTRGPAWIPGRSQTTVR